MTNKVFYSAAARALQNGEDTRIYMIIEGENAGEKALVADKLLVQNEGMKGFWQECINSFASEKLPTEKAFACGRVFAEELTHSPRLVICGGGHVAVPLASIASLLNFEVTVLDDRPEFANKERFPTAQHIICKPFAEGLACVEERSNTYYVIITRGHSADLECLRLILKRPFAYCGMIGSRHKVAVVMNQMEKEGYANALLNRVHSPIGLRIGAETPAEIAVCIAAEMVQVCHKELSEGTLPDAMLEALISPTQPMVMALLVKKSGSAPRGAGARMLVLQDGTVLGSVGGGAGEAELCKVALEVLADRKPRIIECNMTNNDAQKSGMVCGGTITAFLEPVF